MLKLKSRLITLSLSAALFLTGSLTVTASAQEGLELERENVTLAVGGRVALYYLPLNVAELNGYFADEGLNVDIVDFQGGSRSVQAVVGGSADILAAAFEHNITMQAARQDLTSFVMMGRSPGFVLSVIPEIAETWEGMSSLRGKNIGVTAPGSSTNKMVDLLMLEEGLDPAEVSIISVGAGPSVLAAFQNNSIVATVQADPATTLLELEGLAVPVVDTRTDEGNKQVYGGLMPAATLSATNAFVEANPNTVQAITNAIVKALDFINNATAEEIAAILPEEMLIGGDEAFYAEMLEMVRPSFSTDGIVSQEAAQTALNALNIYNEQVRNASNISLEAVYTNRFVETAHNED